MRTFQDFMKSKALSKAEKMNLLHGYRDHLMKGKGKRHATHAPLIREIKQKGGSFHHNQAGTGFFDWLRGAANSVYHKVIKPVGNAVYHKVLKPAYNYAKNKPLSAISKVAGAAAMLPTPFSGALKGVSAVTGAVGNAIGKGMRGGARPVKVNPAGKVVLSGL